VVVTIKKAAAPHPPPVRWLAVILALVLAGFGLNALHGSNKAHAEAGGGDAPGWDGLPPDRDGIILEIARLDESFASIDEPSKEQRAAYTDRRAVLVRRLKG
jgi:hypothetical protein